MIRIMTGLFHPSIILAMILTYHEHEPPPLSLPMTHSWLEGILSSRPLSPSIFPFLLSPPRDPFPVPSSFPTT